MLRRRTAPFYPLVAAAFPAVFLYAQNTGEGISLAEFIVPLAALTGVVALLILGMRLIVKDGAKASALIVVLILVIFAYGPIKDVLWNEQANEASFLLGHHRFLVPTAVALALASGSIVLRYRGSLEPLVNAVAIGALLLILFNVARIGFDEIGGESVSAGAFEATEEVKVPFDQLPDIYYIIFDGYARADVLERLYDFDNTPFLDSLTEKGFYVATESVPNYLSTEYSLASSLNMRYLGTEEQYGDITKDSAVLRFVRRIGYQYVHLDSGLGNTKKNQYADVQFLDDSLRRLLLNDYSAVLFNSTIFEPVARKFGFVINAHLGSNRKNLFEANMGYITTVADIPGPTFTFAHNLPPHPFFILDQDEPNYADDDPAYFGFYIAKIIYINEVISDVIDDILENSPTDPIIVVQSDHGPQIQPPCPLCPDSQDQKYSWERTKILNAYHLPEQCKPGPYPGISPVNSFRVIFNSCLGTNFDLLEDVTYKVPN